MTASEILRAALVDTGGTAVMDEPEPRQMRSQFSPDPSMSEPDEPRRRRSGGRRKFANWSRVTENTVTVTEKGVKLQFAVKPPEHVLSLLKSCRWWFTNGYWLHQRDDEAVAMAKRVAGRSCHTIGC